MQPREILAVLRLDDNRPWLRAAFQFQRDDALEVLEGDRPYTFLTRARGSSKTTDLAAVALSLLLTAEHRWRGYWLASDADQAALAVDCIAGFVARTPGLKGRVVVQARKVLVSETGAQLEILPADAAGAWGLTPDFVACDELCNWADVPSSRRLWEAASSAAAKKSDCRLVVLSTPSSPDHFSFKILESARVSPLWRVSEREGPSPWMDEARLEEQRQRLPHAVYEQLFEARWTIADGAFIDPDVLAQAFRLDGPVLDRRDSVERQLGVRAPGGSHVAGLDLGLKHDRTVLSVGHRVGDEVLLDWQHVWQGTRKNPVRFEEIEEHIVAQHNWFRFELRMDPWQGLDLAERLRGRGITVEEYNFSQASKQKLAATLLSTLNSSRLALYEAEGLRDELLALRLVQNSAGGWAFDHKSGGHDDRAVSLGLMVLGVLEKPAGLDLENFKATPGASFLVGAGRPSMHAIGGPRSGSFSNNGGFI